MAGGSGNRKKLYGMLGEEEGKKMGCQSLNPDWVEKLMNWPKGWSSLEPMENCDILAGWGDDWEGDTPRTAVGTPNRVARLKAIGNGQVPVCVVLAWNILSGMGEG